jgi:hypothetical protein
VEICVEPCISGHKFPLHAAALEDMVFITFRCLLHSTRVSEIEGACCASGSAINWESEIHGRSNIRLLASLNDTSEQKCTQANYPPKQSE